MRYREVRTEEMERARTAVSEWRESHPDGTREQLIDDLGGEFPSDFPMVLRGILFRIDRDRQATGYTEVSR